MYRVAILDDAVRSLSKLDRSVARRIREKLHHLAQNAEAIRHLALSADLSGFYKLRVGDYRVIYKILRDEEVPLVYALGHRSTIYRNLA